MALKAWLWKLTLVALLISSSSQAQWVTSDGFNPVNPNSGGTPDPVFTYNQVDGIFSIINNGNNGIVDSSNNAELLGDDFGFISLLISFTGHTDELAPIFPIYGDAIAWANPVIFNDKIQLSGNAIAASFLPVRREPFPMFQLDAGLTFEDFSAADGAVSIETGMNYSLGVPGITLFSEGDPLATGAFQIVPEPAPLVPLFFGMMGLLLRRHHSLRQHVGAGLVA